MRVRNVMQGHLSHPPELLEQVPHHSPFFPFSFSCPFPGGTPPNPTSEPGVCYNVSQVKTNAVDFETFWDWRRWETKYRGQVI